MNTNYAEQIETLQEAQDKLREVIDLIKEATSGTELGDTTDAYLIPALERAIDDNHEWGGRNYSNLDILIEEAQEMEADRVATEGAMTVDEGDIPYSTYFYYHSKSRGRICKTQWAYHIVAGEVVIGQVSNITCAEANAKLDELNAIAARPLECVGKQPYRILHNQMMDEYKTQWDEQLIAKSQLLEDIVACYE